jgi:hypothetical protein
LIERLVTKMKLALCFAHVEESSHVLLQYSRQVKESFKTLFSLLIADKIKSTLPEACLDHVLTSEGVCRATTGRLVESWRPVRQPTGGRAATGGSNRPI